MSQTGKHPSKIQSDSQAQLEASERRFRSLVHNGSDLMAILDTNGVYTYVTDPTRRVLGYTAGYFIGKNALDYIHPDDQPLVKAELAKLAPRAHAEFGPYRFRASNGEWRWIETKITNLSDDPAVDGLVVNSRDVTDKLKMESERLLEAEKKQRQITRAIVQAQEKERHDIGNELHDNVNQLLTTVKLYLVMVKDSPDMSQNLLPKAIEYIQDCINEIRKLTNRLVSPHIREMQLNESVRELIDSIALTGKLQLNFHPADMDDAEITEELQLTVYRIIQEQLTNIIRHANATAVNIALDADDGILHLTITDNGHGFDVNQKRKGVGLTNMVNRAETVSGSLKIHSEPGAGCSLVANFPIK